MITLITGIHVFLCFVLMVVILLQAGKGAEIGAVFGGSSQTIFGSRGAATFLSKITTICAIGFMVTSLSLVYLSSMDSTSSIMDQDGQVEQTEPGDDAAVENNAEEAGDVEPEAVTNEKIPEPGPEKADN